MNDPETNEVATVGKLRAITAHARAVDPVKVWVYLPNTRGPVECVIASWALKPPATDQPNALNLYVRPVAEEHPDEPPLPVVDEPDKGTAGRRTERVPSQDDTKAGL